MTTEHTFSDCLAALERILAHCGETNWANAVAHDRREWETSRRVESFLAKCGGAGTLNDLFLRDPRGGGDTIPILFDVVKAVAAQWAKNHARPDRATPVADALPRHRLSGWRCPQCGYGETTQTEFDHYILHQLVSTQCLTAFAAGRLTAMVDTWVRDGGPSTELERTRYRKLLSRSRITVTERTTPNLTQCPRCQNTAVYRQEWIEKGWLRRRFVPWQRPEPKLDWPQK